MVHHSPDLSQSDWPQQLIRQLERQQSLVAELSALGQRQRELIQAEQTDALLGLLGRRQEVIEQFTASQEALGAVTKNLDARLEGIEAEQRRTIQTLIEEIGDQLANVMRQDEDDQRTLAAARDEAKNGMSSIDLARQARQAYHRGRSVHNRFADRKG